MKKIEKDIWFTIHDDQWITQELIIKTDGWVLTKLVDRKEFTEETNYIATWQDFYNAHINNENPVFQQVAQYIQDELLSCWS